MSLLDGLVSYYNLNESGGDALDSHGANDLTDTGDPTGTTIGGIPCRRLLPASLQHFSAADTGVLSFGDVALTFAIWVRLFSISANRVVFGKYHSNDMRSYVLQYIASSGRFNWLMSSDGSANVMVNADELGTPTINTWYFLVASYDPTNDLMSIQVNDGTPDPKTHSDGASIEGVEFRLGHFATGGSSYWNGYLARLGVWNRLLTDEEKTFLYNNGLGREYSELSIAPKAMHQRRMRP